MSTNGSGSMWIPSAFGSDMLRLTLADIRRIIAGEEVVVGALRVMRAPRTAELSDHIGIIHVEAP